MLTILSTPKPFEGHIGLIQRNAIGSWVRLSPRPQIILFGRLAPEPVKWPLSSASSTSPRSRRTNSALLICVDSSRAGETAGAPQSPLLRQRRHHPDRGARARRAVRTRATAAFLMVSARINLDLDVPILFETDWRRLAERAAARRAAARATTRASISSSSPRVSIQNIPPLAIGRAWFDQWMIKAAAQRGLDRRRHRRSGRSSTRTTVTRTSPADASTVYQGVEAERNLAIYGGEAHAYTLLELHPRAGLATERSAGSISRKERFRARQVLWDLFVRRTGTLPSGARDPPGRDDMETHVILASMYRRDRLTITIRQAKGAAHR